MSLLTQSILRMVKSKSLISNNSFFRTPHFHKFESEPEEYSGFTPKNDHKDVGLNKLADSGIENGNKLLKALGGIKYIESQQKLLFQETPTLVFSKKTFMKYNKKGNYFVKNKRLIDFIDDILPQHQGDDSVNPESESDESDKPDVDSDDDRKDNEDSETEDTDSPDPELKDFQLIKMINKGGFGKVFLAKNTLDGKYYAMKRIRKDLLIETKQIENTLNEKRVLMSNSNPFLLSMSYCYQSEYRIYFFLDYIPGGNLYENMFKARRFNEEQVKFYAAQLVIAFATLHKNNIVHRDLKPENVLLKEDGYIVLADFGLAKIFEHSYDVAYTQVGTSEYMAPEVLKGEAQSFTLDWWTLGILIYELV